VVSKRVVGTWKSTCRLVSRRVSHDANNLSLLLLRSRVVAEDLIIDLAVDVAWTAAYTHSEVA
jgi:hypothetical protein